MSRGETLTVKARLRDVARGVGLGRLRDRVRWEVNSLSWWTAVPPYRLKDLDPKRSCPSNAVALTFDDGPNPAVTPRLLELLASYSAHATFFMCGRAAERYPELAKDVASAGHAIGGHTWNHPHAGIKGISGDAWQREIEDTRSLLRDITDGDVDWFRPPRGIIDRPTWRHLRSHGLNTVMWTVDGRDCTLRNPNSIADRVLAELEPGGIVLLHDANANYFPDQERLSYGEPGNQETTIVATKIILEGLAERGWSSVSIDLLGEYSMPRSGRPRWMATRDK